MTGQRLAVESDHALTLDAMLKGGVRGPPDIAAMASLGKNTLSVLVWHYHDDDVAGPPASIEMRMDGLPFEDSAKLEHFRIDAEHSNAFAAWQRAGSPQQPTPEQYAQLEKAGQLTALGSAERVTAKDRTATLRFSLPRQAVSLLKLQW